MTTEHPGAAEQSSTLPPRPTPTPTPTPTPGRRWGPWAALIAVVLLIAAGLAVVWTYEPPPDAPSPEASDVPRSVLVISDSLGEGMGEVSDITRTWPNLLGARLRRDLGLEPASGTWLPASRYPDNFDFDGPEHEGGEPFLDYTGVPGSWGAGAVTWDVTGYERVRIHVAAQDPGVTYEVDNGAETISYTTSTSSEEAFEVPVEGSTLTVTGDAAVLGVMGFVGDDAVQVVNFSWSGATTADWQGWLEKDPLQTFVSQFAPDVVIISLGGNDYWSDDDPAGLRDRLLDLHATLSALSPDSAWVFGTQPNADQSAPARWQELQAATRVVAEEVGASLIDLVEEMPTVETAPELYSDDRVHLTDAGQAFIANEAYPAVLDAQAARGSS